MTFCGSTFSTEVSNRRDNKVFVAYVIKINTLHQDVLASRPATTTQTRVRIYPAMHPIVCLHQMPFLLQPFLFPGLGTSS